MRPLAALLALPVLAQTALFVNEGDRPAAARPLRPPRAPHTDTGQSPVSVSERSPVPADLDAVVARAMEQFKVPGVAVGLVKGGKLVFAKGYGVRRLGEPGKVDADTLFGVASNTKAFTAATAALLVEEGKLAWDEPVVRYLPSFRVADPFVSGEITLKDLLSHRTGLGLGQGDLLFWPDTTLTREEVVAGAAHLKPQSSLRSRYAYNNLAFVVAGEVVAKAAGRPWDEVARTRILEPLGMKDSLISRDGLAGRANVAWPHSRGWRADGALQASYVTRDHTWAAAAGLKTSVHDLSKWVAMLLRGGKLPDGKVLLSEKALAEMWKVQTPLTVPKAKAGFEEVHPDFAGYGLGWRLSQYRGRKTVGHGGALTGMLSLVHLVPSLDLGVVILTNQEEGGAMGAILNRILDQSMGAPAKDWVPLFRKQRDEQLAKAQEADRKAEAARNKAPLPLPLSAYEGAFKDPWYGEVTLRLEGQGLVLQMGRTPAMKADLTHWQFETFRAVFRDPDLPDALLSFQRDPSGKIERLRMAPASDLADFSFDFQDLDLRPAK